MLIDTHAHLTMPEYQDIDEVLSRAKAAGLEFIIDVGFDIQSSEKSTLLSAYSNFMYTAVGIHPQNVDRPLQVSRQPKFERSLPRRAELD